MESHVRFKCSECFFGSAMQLSNSNVDVSQLYSIVDLEEHVAVRHAGITLYKCDGCPESFGTAHEAARHLKKHQVAAIMSGEDIVNVPRMVLQQDGLLPRRHALALQIINRSIATAMHDDSAQVLSQQQHFAQQMTSALQRPQMQAIQQQQNPVAIQHGSASPSSSRPTPHMHSGVGKHLATPRSHIIKVTSRSVDTSTTSSKAFPPSWTSGSAASSPASPASSQQPAQAQTIPRTSTGPTPTRSTQGVGTAAGDGSGRSTVGSADVSMNTTGQVESAPSAVANVVQKETVQVRLRTVHFETAAGPASVQSGALATVAAARIKVEPQPLQNASPALATASASPAKAGTSMPTPNIVPVPPVEVEGTSAVSRGGCEGAPGLTGGPATSFRTQPTCTHPQSVASPTPQAGGDSSTALVRRGPPQMATTDNETLTRTPRRFHMTDVNAQNIGRPIPSLVSTIPHPAMSNQHLPLSRQQQYFGHGHGPINMLQWAPPMSTLPCAPPPRESNNNGCFDFNNHVPPKRFSPRSCMAVEAPPAKKQPQPQPSVSPFNTLSPQSANAPQSENQSSGSFVRMVLKERQPLPQSALSLTDQGREMPRSIVEERERSAGANASKESAPGKSTQPAAPVVGDDDDSDVEVILVTPGTGKHKRQKSESRALSCSKEKEREKRSRSRARSKSRHRERSRERDRRSRSRDSRERDRHRRSRSRYDGSRSRSRERRSRERGRRSH